MAMEYDKLPATLSSMEEGTQRITDDQDCTFIEKLTLKSQIEIPLVSKKSTWITSSKKLSYGDNNPKIISYSVQDLTGFRSLFYLAHTILEDIHIHLSIFKL